MKAPKFHHRLNQAPRSAKDNGQYRKTSPQVHGRSAGQSSRPDPGANALKLARYISWFAWDLAAEPEPIENAGIRAGEIIAHRGWRVENGLLTSIYRRDRIWTPGEPMTGDVRGEYGVHAFKSRDQVEMYCMLSTGWGVGWVTVNWNASGGMDIEPVETPTFAIGTVALWGEVIEHEGGYRAEFAKVVSIDVLTDRDGAVLADLQTKYVAALRPDDRTPASTPAVSPEPNLKSSSPQNFTE